jgi:hypothetical protein
MAKTKLNGWVKVIAIVGFILGLAGAIAGFAWDASSKSSAIVNNSDCIKELKSEIVPIVRQNERDIINVQKDLGWLIAGQDDILKEQKKSREIQMKILDRLPKE